MSDYKLGNANKVAKKMRDVIDSYWKGEIDEKQASEVISTIMSDSDNRIKVMRGENYTGVFKSIMGKRRIEEFESLYNK